MASIVAFYTCNKIICLNIAKIKQPRIKDSFQIYEFYLDLASGFDCCLGLDIYSKDNW